MSQHMWKVHLILKANWENFCKPVKSYQSLRCSKANILYHGIRWSILTMSQNSCPKCCPTERLHITHWKVAHECCPTEKLHMNVAPLKGCTWLSPCTWMLPHWKAAHECCPTERLHMTVTLHMNVAPLKGCTWMLPHWKAAHKCCPTERLHMNVQGITNCMMLSYFLSRPAS